MTVRPPLVYLDHWALRRLGENTSERSHFLRTFEKQGTVMFSLMNALEMMLNTGRSYDQLTSFLDDIGPHWLLTEVDPETCQRAEDQGLSQPNCFLTDQRLTAILFNNMPAGTIKLGTALKAVQGDEFRAMADRSSATAALVRVAQQSRADWKAGRKMPTLVIPKGSPRWVELTLLRFFIKDGKTIEENDMTDFLHACVPFVYAHIVMLDGAWANFARKLKLKETHVFTNGTFQDALNTMHSLRVSGIKAR